VTSVLFVTPSLAYSGLARRLSLLAVHLPRDRFQARVVVLGGPSPWGEALRAASVPVDELNWRRAIDARPLAALQRLAADWRPGLVHAWGTAGPRAALLAGVVSPRRLLVSGVLPPVGAIGLPIRVLLGTAGHVLAFGRAEAERYRRLSVPAKRLIEAPLATDPNWPPAPVSTGEQTLPNGSRMLFGVGPLEGHKGFRDAVWALDILHFLYDDISLVLAGAGSERRRIEEFARVTGGDHRVRCTGQLPDLARLRRRAMLAWIPGRGGGVQAALESMSAGLPIVASRTAGLAEVVSHDETGLLAPPGDKADFARQTRRLLDDDTLRRSFGEACRRRAAERFAPGPMADACARAYDRLCQM
jgi:glycosyltransferase involved in cell wall biosynthesis